MTRRIPPPPSQCGVVTVGQALGPMVTWSPNVEIHQGEIVVRFQGCHGPCSFPWRACATASTVGRSAVPDAAGCLLGGVPAPWGGWQHAFGIVLRNETHV